VKIADAALQVLREEGARHVWYGTPDLVATIAERAGVKARHPLNRSAAVIGALRRSTLFRCMGRIRHGGRTYPVFEPAQPARQDRPGATRRPPRRQA
jgi:hypothetical protein